MSTHVSVKDMIIGKLMGKANRVDIRIYYTRYVLPIMFSFLNLSK